jgi:8-oxo-dGTP pyrophosphatase MutT (NUDIX family)
VRQAPAVLRVRHAAYRVAYRLLTLARFVRPSRGRGVKALLVCDGEVLFVRHTYGPDRWELPGGGVRHGEAPLAALHRELEEELGLTIATALPVTTHRGLGRQRRHRTHVFRVDLESREVQADPVEIAEARWCQPGSPPTPLGPRVVEILRSVSAPG